MARSLIEALHTAQSAIKPVTRGGVNRAQGWRFVEASAIVEAARDALTGAGLIAYMIADGPEDPDWLRLSLRVIHVESGDAISLPMPWPVTRTGDQGRRAAFTYARKQALIELLLIADPDEDPEAHAASTEPEPAPREERPRQRGTARSRAQRDAETIETVRANVVTPTQLAEITTELQRLQLPRDSWKDRINVILGNPDPPLESSTSMTIAQATRVLAALRRSETPAPVETVPLPDGNGYGDALPV